MKAGGEYHKNAGQRLKAPEAQGSQKACTTRRGSGIRIPAAPQFFCTAALLRSPPITDHRMFARTVKLGVWEQPTPNLTALVA